jgi:hypothetical protein
MKIKTLIRLSPGPLSRSAPVSGVLPDHAEAVARGCARVDPEWVTLLQNEDFIPDQTLRVGLTDDHAILERVFERNRYELRPFSAPSL